MLLAWPQLRKEPDAKDKRERLAQEDQAEQVPRQSNFPSIATRRVERYSHMGMRACEESYESSHENREGHSVN